ncbi:hypothetical protein [Microbacterium sp. Marseille-Q6965]|uniref:hypothetical protein n=1 Tax=Microbacterium sp. Marseille-Q6965 TaxID=2965072 RepID=UPI0021B7412C|nr:hypothetical protein [Microbacterium sp. Marseille-Q6965]
MTEVRAELGALQGCASTMRSSASALDEAISAAQSSMGLSVEAFGLISGAIFTPPVLGLFAAQTAALQGARLLIDTMAQRVEACVRDYREADERAAQDYRRIDPSAPGWRPIDEDTVIV